MPKNAAARATPQYRAIADKLIRQINEGRFPVGAFLPTELELSARYGVSRGTVRFSLDLVEQAGLISRRQKSGTQVLARYPAQGVVERVKVLEDWTKGGIDFPLHVESVTRRKPPANVGLELGGAAAEQWLCVEGLRRQRGSDLPIAHCEVYVHPNFGEIAGDIGRTPPLIFALIEQRFGRIVDFVRAEMRGALLSDEVANSLKAEPGGAALQIIRAYLDSRRNVIEFAVNTYPAERFSYTMEIKRD